MSADTDACPDFDTLVAHVGGALDEAGRGRVEAHLAECDACLELVAEAAAGLADDVTLASLAASAAAASSVAPGAGPGRASSAPRALPRPGDKVGRYVLEEVLGRGAMGVVYSAHDPELERKVAVKLVRTARRGGPGDAELQARLLAEAQAMARLAHPNVVAVHDIGTIEGGVYLAMERVPGVTLRAWVAARARTWREVVAAYRQAAEGLAAAHAAGLVHRDFKPDNVLVDADGRVRVTDFGLARVRFVPPSSSAPATEVAASSELRKTRAGTVIGTPAYMAPEQLFAAPEVDARADVFALGASLYEALWRARPYPADTLPDLERRLARGVPDEPPPSKVPRFVRRAVLRALAGDPAARFQSMREMIAALARDPVARALRAAVPLALVVAVAGGVAVAWHLTTAPARACREGAEATTAVWSETARAEAAAAFERSGLTFAGEAFARASEQLEQHLAAWRQARVAACDATHEEGAQSEALLDLKLRCPDQRLAEARALAERFTHADAGVVQKAIEAVSALPRAAICAEDERLRARVPPPADPAAAALVREAEERLAKAEAALATGDTARVETLAEEARARAVEAHHAASEASALALLARLRRGTSEAWLAQLEAAMTRALASGDARLAAMMTTAFARELGSTTRATEEPLRWTRVAEAQVAALAGGAAPDAALSADVALARAEIRFLVFDTAGAIGELEGALAHGDALDGPRRVALLAMAARTQQQAEHYAEAIGLFDRTLALAREVYGPAHPKTVGFGVQSTACLLGAGHYTAALARAEATMPAQRALARGDDMGMATLTHLTGATLVNLGRYDEGLALHTQGLAMERRLYGDALAQVAVTTTFVVFAQARAGRGVEGLAAADELDALIAKHLPGNGEVLAMAKMLRGLALEAAGRDDEAAAHFRGVEADAAAHPVSATTVAWSRDGLGREALRRGRAEDAVRLHEGALALMEAHYEPTSLELAPTLRDLGRALGAMGRRAEAVKVLERGLAMSAAEAADPLLVAELECNLAAALEAGPRAEALRTKARATTAASPYPRAKRACPDAP